MGSEKKKFIGARRKLKRGEWIDDKDEQWRCHCNHVLSVRVHKCEQCGYVRPYCKHPYGL